jgi:hypothetical protein
MAAWGVWVLRPARMHPISPGALVLRPKRWTRRGPGSAPPASMVGCILGGKAAGNVLCELDQAVASAAGLGVWLWNRCRAKVWVVQVAAPDAGRRELP